MGDADGEYTAARKAKYHALSDMVWKLEQNLAAIAPDMQEAKATLEFDGAGAEAGPSHAGLRDSVEHIDQMIAHAKTAIAGVKQFNAGFAHQEKKKEEEEKRLLMHTGPCGLIWRF